VLQVSKYLMLYNNVVTQLLTCVNSAECQSQCKFQENPDICIGLDDKERLLTFRKDKESVMNIGKLLKFCIKVLGMKHSSLQVQDLTQV
jgi:hypothetical protein